MTAEFFAQSSEAANVDLWPVRSSSSALPGGAKGAFTMAVLRRRAAGRSDESSRSGHSAGPGAIGDPRNLPT